MERSWIKTKMPEDALELLKSKSNDLVYLKLIKEIEEQLVDNNKYID